MDIVLRVLMVSVILAYFGFSFVEVRFSSIQKFRTRRLRLLAAQVVSGGEQCVPSLIALLVKEARHGRLMEIGLKLERRGRVVGLVLFLAAFAIERQLTWISAYAFALFAGAVCVTSARNLHFDAVADVVKLGKTHPPVAAALAEIEKEPALRRLIHGRAAHP